MEAAVPATLSVPGTHDIDTAESAIFDSCYQKLSKGDRETFLRCSEMMSAPAKWLQQRRWTASQGDMLPGRCEIPPLRTLAASTVATAPMGTGSYVPGVDSDVHAAVTHSLYTTCTIRLLPGLRDCLIDKGIKWWPGRELFQTDYLEPVSYRFSKRQKRQKRHFRGVCVQNADKMIACIYSHELSMNDYRRSIFRSMVMTPDSILRYHQQLPIATQPHTFPCDPGHNDAPSAGFAGMLDRIAGPSTN